MKKPFRHWTQEETKIIKENHYRTANEIKHLLPDRTFSAINTKLVYEHREIKGIVMPKKCQKNPENKPYELPKIYRSQIFM